MAGTAIPLPQAGTTHAVGRRTSNPQDWPYIRFGNVTITGPTMREMYAACIQVLAGSGWAEPQTTAAEPLISGISGATATGNTHRKRRPMSAAARAKLSAAAKKRWTQQNRKTAQPAKTMTAGA